MKEELQKQRDKLADKLVRQYQMPFDPAFIDCVNYYKDGFDACYDLMSKDIEHCRSIAEQDAKEYADLLKHHKELKKQLSVDYQYQTIKELQAKLDAAKKALENLEGHTIAHLQFPHKDTSNLTLALLAARQALKEMEIAFYD